MPAGHTVADMADDYADAIVEGLGGCADLVVGESYGGMIGQHLAAAHPDRFRHLALVVTACEVNEWGKGVDSRMAAALLRGDLGAAGAAFAEYVLPQGRAAVVRRVLGPLVGRFLFSDRHYPSQDVLVEIEAEMSFDSRRVLPRIEAPVLLVCGDRDQFFPQDVVEETAALIPDCTLVWYPGKGHVATASSKQVAHDVLAHVAAVERRGP
jgi:pimeloyl-ACP methyl ester carboxylesterase